MWCYLTKKGNLNLCTINVNGKPMGWELQRLLLQLANEADCPIDGFVLIDTRTPEDQVGFQTREWQAVFGEKELVIRVLSGKHQDGGGTEDHWAQPCRRINPALLSAAGAASAGCNVRPCDVWPHR
jgi:hypothetical protein